VLLGERVWSIGSSRCSTSDSGGIGACDWPVRQFAISRPFSQE
jgi:hypothetical protein